MAEETMQQAVMEEQEQYPGRMQEQYHGQVQEEYTGSLLQGGEANNPDQDAYLRQENYYQQQQDYSSQEPYSNRQESPHKTSPELPGGISPEQHEPSPSHTVT